MKNLFLVILFIGLNLNAQNKNVDNLLEKHFKKVNQEKLNTIKSLRIKGNFVQNGLNLNLEIYKQRPNKWRQNITLNNSKMIAVINGDSGWEINEFSGVNEPVDYDAAKINEYETSATIDNQLWYLKEQNASFKIIGNETIDKKELVKVEVTDNHKKTIHFWLDTNTHLIYQTLDLATKQKLVYKEFQIIDEIYFPKKVSAGSYELVFSTIELNPELDASQFSKDSIKTSKDIAAEYLKAFYDLNYDKLVTFYTDESYWFDPSTSVILPNVQKSIGKEKIVADLKAGFNGVQDAKYTFEKVFYSGPYVAIWGNYYYRIPAKYFQGLMTSDAVFEFSIPMVTNLVIKDGKVLEHLEHGDWSNWAKQVQANAQKTNNK